MKKNKIYILASLLGVSGMLAGCSDNYLDLSPKTDIPDNQLGEYSQAYALMNGVYEAMNVQYTALTVNQNVGESTINMIIGDACGTDFISALWNDMPGLRLWNYMADPNAYSSRTTWNYYYNIINLSNYLIVNIPETSADPGTADMKMLDIKAQALTMRAHAYTRLLGYYGQRWEDSDNGNAYCIVIRTEPSTDPTPLVTMNDVLKLIYSDLDEAVALFDLSKISRDAEEVWRVNVNVANGIYARAAMICHDWQTAADKAAAARAGYSIMGEKELFSGFITNVSENIWSMNPIETTTYYWSWGSHYAVNGAYINNWNITPGAINYNLYKEAKALNPSDLRLKFFWTPDKLSEVKKTFNPGGMKEKDFWNPKVVGPLNDMSMTIQNPYAKNDTNRLGMTNCVAAWLYNYHHNTFTGDESLIANDDQIFNAYILQYVENTKKNIRIGKDAAGRAIYVQPLAVPFGSQNKFWAAAPYGNMAMPWMRASEMALTEAEAYFMLGDEAKAKAALTDVQSKRISGYACRTSGDALLNEIKVSRRLELWGEGFNFLDLKRWNVPRDRHAALWIPDDVNSGNISEVEFSGLKEAEIKKLESVNYCNGWRLMLPLREYEYNNEIDMSLLKTIPNN